MRAAVVVAHGAPENLECREVDRPSPGRHWIRVRVAACGLNMLDVFVRRGMPGVSLDLPHIPGGDIVGWVDEVGPGVTAPAEGQLVLIDPIVGHKALGENLPGGLADYAIVPADNAIPLRPDDDPVAYAALPIAYGTARRMLHERARVAAGETVVVLGAAGGVGVACIQLGADLGARVVACSSSPAKLARLAELGAAETLNTGEEGWSTKLWDLTGRRGADVVIDYLGADTWPASVRALRHGGRLVTCGATTGFSAVTDLRYVWTRELDILGSDGWTRADLLALAEQVRRGELTPVVHAVYPLSEVRAAIADLEERRALGKVVVVPDGVGNRRA